MTDDERAVYDAYRAHRRVFTGHALDALDQTDANDVADLLARAHARWKPSGGARATLGVRHSPKGSSRAGGGSGGPGGQE